MSEQPRLPVVVGIDGSRDGLVALDWAAWFARIRRTPLLVVHVEDESARPHHAGEVLEDAGTELGLIRFDDARLEVRHGRPATTLLELSAEALVIGRRGMGGFAELVPGSTSQVCTALARIPLIVVPDSWDPSAPRTGRIVVGVDGSPDGQGALRFAFDLASATDSRLDVLHAVDPRETEPRQAEPRQAEVLDGWPAKYPEVSVETRCAAGHPVQLLAAASRSADLIVVGGFCRTHFTPLRLGSVSRGLLHHTHCPVAVIHHVPDEAPEKDPAPEKPA